MTRFTSRQRMVATVVAVALLSAVVAILLRSGGPSERDAVALVEPQQGTFLLTPGDTFFWHVELAGSGAGTTGLVLTLSADPVAADLSMGLSGVVTVDVRTCSEPWRDDHCAGRSATVLGPVLLNRVATSPAMLAGGEGLDSPDRFLLAGVTLSPTVAPSIQGAGMVIRLGVHSAEGEAPAKHVQDLTLSAALGLAAVVVGLALSYWKSPAPPRRSRL